MMDAQSLNDCMDKGLAKNTCEELIVHREKLHTIQSDIWDNLSNKIGKDTGNYNDLQEACNSIREARNYLTYIIGDEEGENNV